MSSSRWKAELIAYLHVIHCLFVFTLYPAIVSVVLVKASEAVDRYGQVVGFWPRTPVNRAGVHGHHIDGIADSYNQSIQNPCNQ